MWISRKKFEELEDRVSSLQRRIEVCESALEFTVYPDTRWSEIFIRGRSQTVKVKDVVARLLRIAGYKIKYTNPPQPEDWLKQVEDK